MNCNIFQHSSATNRPETELPPLNTDDFSGLDVSPLSPGPSFTTIQGPRDLHHDMSPGHERASQSSGAASGYDEDSPEAWTSRLAALATRATHTAKHIAPSDTSAPLIVSSPQVEEVFDVTSTLLCILDSVSEALRVASSSSPESASEPVDASLTQDPGLVFLILACYQRLLDSFQAMCNSIRRSLRSMSPNGTGHHGTLSWKRTLHGDEGRPCVAQFVMVLQLVSHLLNQLDRALNPSSVTSLPRRQESWSSFDFAAITDHNASPSWMRMPPGSPNGSQGDAASFLFGQEADAKKSSNRKQGFMGLAKGVLMKVPDQHTTLNNQIRELQDSIDHFSRL